MNTLNHVKKTLVNAANGAGETIVDAAKSARDAIVDAKDTVVDAAVDAKDAVVDTAVDVKDAVVDAARDAKDKTVDVAHDAKHRVVGFADTVVGAFTGPSPRDILEVLKSDHELVSGFFEQLEATSRTSRELRKGLFEQLKYELEMHSLAEEKLFYPALRKGKESPELLKEAHSDHDLVKQLLVDLTTQNVDSEAWLGQLRVLKENVLRHVQMEEDELFACAKDCMSSAQREELGLRFQQSKSRLDVSGGTDRGARGNQAARTGTVRKTSLKKSSRGQNLSAHH